MTTEQTTDMTAKWAALREPFPASAIAQLPRAGLKLDYVGHAEVTDRLLAVDPEWNWEPAAVDDHGLPWFHRSGTNGAPIGLWIRLTVCGVTRLGYGSVAGDAFDPEKQLIGDAIRNAAMRFGVALDLWSKSERAQAAIHDEEPVKPRHPVGNFDPDEDAVPHRQAGRGLQPVNPQTGEYEGIPYERVVDPEAPFMPSGPAIPASPAAEWTALAGMMAAAHLRSSDMAEVLGGTFNRAAFELWMSGHAGRSAQVLVDTVLRERERQGAMAGAR